MVSRISMNTLVITASLGGLIVTATGYMFREKIINDIQKSPVYIQGLDTLRNHAGARKLLGDTIRDDKFKFGDKDLNHWTAELAFFTVPVRGPKAKGEYKFWANKTEEGWTITKAELRLANDNERVLAVKREVK